MVRPETLPRRLPSSRAQWKTPVILAAALCLPAVVLCLQWFGFDLSAMLSGSQPAHLPRMPLAEVRIGEVRTEGGVKSVLVPIVNGADREVVIAHVSAGCGCVSAAPTSGDRIAPRSIGFVEAQTNPERAKLGRNEADLIVTFADSATPPIGCRVWYNYAPTVRVLDRSIMLASNENRPLVGSPGYIATAQIRLVDASVTHDLRVLQVRGTSPYLDFGTPARDSASGLTVVQTRLKVGAPVGEADDKIVIATNMPNARDIVVDAHLRVAGAVRVEPAKLVIRQVLPMTEFTARVACSSPAAATQEAVHLLSNSVEPADHGT